MMMHMRKMKLTKRSISNHRNMFLRTAWLWILFLYLCCFIDHGQCSHWRKWLYQAQEKMNVPRIVHQIVKHVEHWRRLHLANGCSHIHTRSVNMDLCRCDNDNESHVYGGNSRQKRWRDILSNVSMYIEYLRSLVNGLDQYSMASSIENWTWNLPVEADDEGHSLWDDFHQRIFVDNRLAKREMTSPNWSFVAKLVEPLDHQHRMNQYTSTKTLSSWSIDSRIDEELSQSLMIHCLSI